MNDAKDKAITFNVRLKPSESSAHPQATNYTNVGVAQGIAYVDFGFIEPTLHAAIAKTAKDGQAAPKGLEGSRACISRFSTYWSARAMHGNRSRKPNTKRGSK